MSELCLSSTSKRRLQSKADDETEELDRFEELEAYRIVFDTTMFDVRESPVEDLELKSEDNCLQALESPVVPKCSSEEKAVKTIQPVMEEKSLEGFLKVLDEFENIDYIVEEKKVKPAGTKSNKVEEHKEESMVTSGSEAMGNKLSDATVKVGNDNGRQYISKVTANSESFGANVNGTVNGGDYSSNFTESSRTLCSNLGSCGSMRKEKEWKRTLACKLFEERHNVDGGEGMDLLWETYETNSSTAKPKSNSNSNSKKKNKKKESIDYYDDDDDEDEEEEMNGQLCCLQALKFSAGKMNLGMGRPNLVKISKAIKGIGWLHHVTRGGKKGYN
ncbi:hypothetical protein F0562_002282 [Nyssa sinensis]|uniref:Uncharacterized protein n=1 Tax=Nyssa sinensis TaxID=561372 RepID=A0A5J5C5K9_9ASTE|nr:hypothetical protein F0562_002282 [Nyssa sinensis]